MLNPLNFISKFIKSNNQKELDRIAKIVEKCLNFFSLLHAIFYYCVCNQIGNPEPSFPLG